MSHKLAVPAYDTSPNLTVETRPKQVKEWIEKLPLANGVEAGEELRAELMLTNRTKCAPDTRLKIAELYRTAIHELEGVIEARFFGGSLPLPEKNRKAAQLLRDCYSELAVAYKLALLEFESKLISFGNDKYLPQIIARAIESLNRILIVCYQTYAPTPAGVWSEIHELYRHALQQQLQDVAIADGEPSVTINLAYKQALLLSLADPYRLMPGESLKTLAYIGKFGQFAQLSPLSDNIGKLGFFIIRLDQDKPPQSLAYNHAVVDARTDIVLNTLEIAKLLHQQIHHLESGQSAAQLGLPEAAPISPEYIDLLRRLLKFWGTSPKRHFNRTPGREPVYLCTGIRGVHSMLNGSRQPETQEETAIGDITLQLNTSQIDQTSQNTFQITRWAVVNESAGGLGLAKVSDEAGNIRVGDIIGVRQPKTEIWSIGVIRWLQGEKRTEIRMGAQMLAPHASAVSLRPTLGSGNETFNQALLLPELPLLKQPATLLTPRGLFQNMREFELQDSNGNSHLIRATRLIEQTAAYELFTFQ